MNKKNILIIIITIAILALIGLIIFSITPKSKGLGNTYTFSNEKVKEETYKNDKLSSKHCLDSVCIEDAIFYYDDNMGRVEYTITNTSNKTVSGYLKMIFKNQTLKIVYKDLGPKKTVKSQSQYTGIEIEDKSDYKLEKLTKEEISKIVK